MEDWRIWRIILGFARNGDGVREEMVWLESLNNVPYPPILHYGVSVLTSNRKRVSLRSK
jgi:hypothetical protein